jgi:murein DD-endopeptidase MepM/ murein hydrolase activator NlpD
MTDQESQPEINSNRQKIARIVINLIMVMVLFFLALLIWQRVAASQSQAITIPFLNNSDGAKPMQEKEEIPAEEDIKFSALNLNTETSGKVIFRVTDYQTKIPLRTDSEIITYTVQKGHTLFEIAEKFNLKPETILFGNYDVLEDNPHILSPDMVLNILPVDGAYYQWKDGDTLEFVSGYYQVQPDDILEFSGNEIDLTAQNLDTYDLSPGSMLVIPGGTRPIKDWGPPAITRQNPASARFYGSGHCGAVYEGAVGTGTFVWPSVVRSISGYAYSGIHPAIDIGGAIGNAIFASDSGVIVYAGWSDYGYGYLIVIDHGNGFQTAYAHLSTVAVSCGQSVYQGGYIGAMGSTGNSSGPHLHFEIIYNGAKPNPLDFLQ